MTENTAALPLEAAAITDRGLNEKRPLNEDSMLSDEARHIFAVADGVGGAQAGEVASRTAIEILSEAFREHRSDDDAEDLLEIAIQRANDSIYRQSRENPEMAMMATTIVALHLQGLRATVGHVGDSRLYRLTPAGRLSRETDDHSLVEEEVRAGRMTPEQAASHPGRNVISRALGAESSVEVDVRTFEVEAGTTFLLCSDGITRHIPDEELSELLRRAPSLKEACGEMKRLCYERGAEDNLTAVLVRVGGGAAAHELEDAERGRRRGRRLERSDERARRARGGRCDARPDRAGRGVAAEQPRQRAAELVAEAPERVGGRTARDVLAEQLGVEQVTVSTQWGGSPGGPARVRAGRAG
jgi:protein phosphatase